MSILFMQNLAKIFAQCENTCYTNLMATLSERIREMRAKYGYSLADLADRLGVSQATVHRYEKGAIPNIKHKMIVRMAEIFDCMPSYLMGWEDIPKKRTLEIPPILNDVQVAFCGEIGDGLKQEDIDMLVMMVKRMKRDSDDPKEDSARKTP